MDALALHQSFTDRLEPLVDDAKRLGSQAFASGDLELALMLGRITGVLENAQDELAVIG